jgi:hypothetical protein
MANNVIRKIRIVNSNGSYSTYNIGSEGEFIKSTEIGGNESDVETRLDFLEEEVEENKAVNYAVTLSVADWETVSGEAYVKAIKTVEGIKATDNPIVDVLTSLANHKAELEDWAKLFKVETAENQVIFYADEAFENQVVVQIKVV